MKKNTLLILLKLFFPLFNLVIIGLFLFTEKKIYLKELIAFTLFQLGFFSLIFFSKKNKIRFFLLHLIVIISSLLVFIKLSFLHYYKARINASAIYIISETNYKEAYSFILNYISGWNTLFFITAIIPILIPVKKNNPFIKDNFHKPYFKPIFLAIFILYLLVVNKKFYHEDLIFKTFKDLKTYNEYKSGLKNQLSQNTPKFLKQIAYNNEDQTHIVIIGESTTRNHMQLYSYHRETNPNLINIKPELLIFNNVISPHTHTLSSLEKILTLKSFENNKPKDNLSVVQLANSANYETYWVSMQEPLGFDETLTTLISNAADYRFFLESSSWFEESYDGKVLKKIKEITKNPCKRKVVFVHLIGTHSPYSNRYPSKFNFFYGQPKTKFNHKKAYRTINEYDNAIRYNDYVVSEIIKIANEIKSAKTTVTYFSDHGEEVFSLKDYMGHDGYQESKNMYDVPFFIWFSKKSENNFTKLKEVKNIQNRPYILEDFPHTFSELLEIDFNFFNPQKSILNKKFNPKKRLISGNRNYDEIEFN